MHKKKASSQYVEKGFIGHLQKRIKTMTDGSTREKEKKRSLRDYRSERSWRLAKIYRATKLICSFCCLNLAARPNAFSERHLETPLAALK